MLRRRGARRVYQRYPFQGAGRYRWSQTGGHNAARYEALANLPLLGGAVDLVENLPVKVSGKHVWISSLRGIIR